MQGWIEKNVEKLASYARNKKKHPVTGQTGRQGAIREATYKNWCKVTRGIKTTGTLTGACGCSY